MPNGKDGDDPSAATETAAKCCAPPNHARARLDAVQSKPLATRAAYSKPVAIIFDRETQVAA
jgi:hypothetical protein